MRFRLPLLPAEAAWKDCRLEALTQSLFARAVARRALGSVLPMPPRTRGRTPPHRGRRDGLVAGRGRGRRRGRSHLLRHRLQESEGIRGIDPLSIRVVHPDPDTAGLVVEDQTHDLVIGDLQYSGFHLAEEDPNTGLEVVAQDGHPNLLACGPAQGRHVPDRWHGQLLWLTPQSLRLREPRLSPGISLALSRAFFLACARLRSIFVPRFMACPSSYPAERLAEHTWRAWSFAAYASVGAIPRKRKYYSHAYRSSQTATNYQGLSNRVFSSSLASISRLVSDKNNNKKIKICQYKKDVA